MAVPRRGQMSLVVRAGLGKDDLDRGPSMSEGWSIWTSCRQQYLSGSNGWGFVLRCSRTAAKLVLKRKRTLSGLTVLVTTYLCSGSHLRSRVLSSGWIVNGRRMYLGSVEVMVHRAALQCGRRKLAQLFPLQTSPMSLFRPQVKSA